ncbi:hypothetical protein ACQ4PT_071525 [Festuca glaucescens]
MEVRQIKGKEKVLTRDSTSEDSETMSGDVLEQNHHAFWTIRDTDGWKHGTMVDGNRQHWKCNYCSITGRSGGVSGLKRHLVGHRVRAKKCLAVPEDVTAEINLLIKARKEERQKRAALKAPNNPAFIASAEPRDLIPSTSHGLISHVQNNCSSILRELAQGSIVLAHVPGETCYCSFCTLEKANEGPEYEQMRLGLLQTKMVQVVDMMLSAAEELSAEEQSLTITK